MIEVLEFVLPPTLVALVPAAIAASRRRLKLAMWLVVGAITVTLGVPFAVGMSGMDAARPHAISVHLLASIVLVWPLAVLSFAVGALIATSSQPKA